MSTRVIVKTIFAFFILSVLIVGGFLYRSRFVTQTTSADKSSPQPKDEESEPDSKPTTEPEDQTKADRVETIEDALTDLTKKQEEQEKLIEDLSKKIGSSSASKTTTTSSGQSILDTAQTEGGQFTTTSAVYSPMGMFVNVTCSRSCLLWINFSTVSRNLDVSASYSSYINTYGLFIDQNDKSIYTQASIPLPNTPVPMSFNAAIPVGAGTHTVDIQAKTTAGTLRSDLSQLQVVAIEQ